ncbi:outer membrane transport energization protein ExbD [Halopseudomonas xinjiangensis]|uniref:Outer membrane transport energization protein ExbD n=1 Tax=Halopseudomonas xinjiangensis TaxID=487184 RepID=A0A1H1Q164_9GAMM|nr:biopolymer transporter ExbD [Halopseudomonas xinjiangensis]SDS17212.1 outer membrane transport energization protein ExbD [Halopseudomonas xinjiangensis]
MQAAGLYSRKPQKISLTALIDVVFILLMFFMLTSTFSQWKAVDFQSPVASTEPSLKKPDVLILSADGSLRMADGSHAFNAGEAVGAGAFATDAVLVLLPEADARVQIIVSRLEELKGLGLAVTMGGVTDPTGRGN